MKKALLFLQLFSGEGTAPAEGSGEAENANESELATQGQRVVYGRQEEKTEEQSKADENESGQQQEYGYEQAKKQFKEEFQSDIQRIIDKRFKNSKKIEADRDRLQQQLGQITEVLGARYGTDNIEEILKSISEDESFYEAAALEKGVSVETFKANLRADRLQKEKDKAAQESEQAAIVENWQKEATDLTEIYPDFNLEDEIGNEKFAAALQRGESMRDAYQLAHFDDIIGGIIRMTADTVKTNVAKAKAERQSRPAENGASITAPAIVKNDVSKLSKADMEEIDRQVLRGNRISF